MIEVKLEKSVAIDKKEEILSWFRNNSKIKANVYLNIFCFEFEKDAVTFKLLFSGE